MISANFLTYHFEVVAVLLVPELVLVSFVLAAVAAVVQRVSERLIDMWGKTAASETRNADNARGKCDCTAVSFQTSFHHDR